MSNARIQFSLASEAVWNSYNPQLKEGEIVTVLKANKKVKLVQGKVGGSTYSESTVIWDEDTAETTMSRAEAAAVTATAQANAASGSASKAAASQAAAATSATNAAVSADNAKNEANRAKAEADKMGDVVTEITESQGTVTVNKSDGSSSNFTTFPKFVEIPANADLNDYQQEGFYICKTNKESVSLKNCPVKSAFLMEVYKTSYMYEGTQDSWCHQRIIVFNTSLVYIRAYGSWDGGEWYLWQSTPAIGTILPFAGINAIPNGYLVCDGAAISRTTYALLFDVIGTTYGDGDGSSTFNLPNLKGRYIEGQLGSAVGTVWEPGLPNIEAFYDDNTGYANADKAGWHGAVYLGNLAESKITSDSLSDGLKYCHTWKFDASKSNAIYGNATTVQPPAVTMRYIIKY